MIFLGQISWHELWPCPLYTHHAAVILVCHECNHLPEVLVRSFSFSSVFLSIYTPPPFFYHYCSLERFWSLLTDSVYSDLTTATPTYCEVLLCTLTHGQVPLWPGRPSNIIYFTLVCLQTHSSCFCIHKHTFKSRISLSRGRCCFWIDIKHKI